MNSITYKNYTIEIKEDRDCQSPDDWGDDNLFLVGFHNQFYVKREGYTEGLCQSIVRNGKYEDGSINDEAKDAMKKYHTFILEAYIHSGVSLSLHTGSKKDRWDSSLVGMVFVSKEEFKTRKKAEKCALAHIETWNQYLSGEVYGYNIPELDNEKNCVNSCWGFYGDPEESGLLSDAKSIIDYYIEQHQKKLKVQIKNRIPYEKRLVTNQ